MGKRHFKGGNTSEDRKRRKETAEKWKNTRGDENNRNVWTTVFDNARFQAFYKAQHFIEEGEDWNRFMESLRSPLPACFRINPDYTFAEDLREQLLSFMGEKLVVDGVEIEGVEQIPWFPNGFGYQLGTDRRSIRKLPALNQLHKWMIQHTDNGNITRQEAVSMVPPIALDVQPHHKCLDMCAAPGSKTSQLLEIVNRSLSNPPEEQGLVVANDADTDRTYMLVHQCRRINSPLLVVTTHKGQSFPTVVDLDAPRINAEFFDRVLCDVPCSGDGTLRKNPSIWGRWSISLATALYPLQLLIANRGYQLLKPGGLMVYSTCSMSPYEDEAVVAELLRSHSDLELVDARQFLPKFKVRPGLTNWLVFDDYPVIKKEIQAKKAAAAAARKTNGSNANEAESPEGLAEEVKEGESTEEQPAEEAKGEEATAEGIEQPTQSFDHIQDPAMRACLEMGFLHFPSFADVPENLQWKYKSAIFPPTAEELAWMGLEKCLRCVPQDENTGGFFVATLRKKETPVAEVAVVAAVEEESTTTAPVAVEEEVAQLNEMITNESEDNQVPIEVTKPTAANIKKTVLGSSKGIVEFTAWDNDTFQRLKTFYSLDDRISVDDFFVREDLALKQRNNKQHNGTNFLSKSIYFIPRSARQLIQGDIRNQMKVVTSGVKVFEKKNVGNGEVDYRLMQEGLAVMLPYMSGRKVNLSIQDFCNVLGGGLVSYGTLSASTIQQLQSMTSGVVICTYEYNPEDYIAPPVVTNEEVVAEGMEVDNEDVVVDLPETNEEGVEVSNNKPSAAGADEEELVQPIALGHSQPQGPRDGKYQFHIVGWRSKSATLNVFAPKIDLDCAKHQLAALNVLR